MRTSRATICTCIGLGILSAGQAAGQQRSPIAHDAEYYILEAQNAERWAADVTR